jgi:hypothetical protein
MKMWRDYMYIDFGSEALKGVIINTLIRKFFKLFIESHGFDLAALYLVSLDGKTIYPKLYLSDKKKLFTKKCIMLLRDGYALDPPPGITRNIHAHILRELKRPIVIKGWDSGFDKKVYDTCNQQDLIRAFVPIFDRKSGLGIGTIMAGNLSSNKDYINDNQLNTLEELGSIVGSICEQDVLEPTIAFEKTILEIQHGR